MFHIHYSFTGASALEAGLGRLIDPPLQPLAVRWQRILVEDNRAGILAGTDGDGFPMIQTIYRRSTTMGMGPRPPDQLGAQPAKPKRGIRQGKNIFTSPNLTNKVYRSLSGPPLAPRGAESRIITNFVTQAAYTPTGLLVTSGWDDIVSPEGYPILTAHIHGVPERNLPIRDPRGIRAWGKRQLDEALDNWIRWALIQE